MNKPREKLDKKKVDILQPSKQQIAEVLQHNPTFLEVRNKYNADNNTFYFQFSADKHLDNPESDIEMAKRHLDEVVELNGLSFDFGDQFDAMQSRNDRRSNKSDLKGEVKEGNYLDKLVDHNAEFRGPYAKNIAMMAPGNHETAILKHNETDLIGRLVKELNQTHGVAIKAGLYTGWMKLHFEHTSGGNVKTVLVHFDHGYGGGGPVTKGVIQSNRRAVYLPQPDIVVSGHIHESRVLELVQEMIDDKGNPYLRTQHHVTLPTYKEEYLKGQGWHRERGATPKPMGALLLKVKIDNDKKPQLTFVRQT